ncbi:hypothetical protein GW17_00042352 [Ensete ventricosum]|nr:hypothetical protein GW17_00042352 [Ensete ventricosum]RZS20827.1 hypothetical protein BHM03_00053396 [Ensete ventricosum]
MEGIYLSSCLRVFIEHGVCIIPFSCRALESILPHLVPFAPTLDDERGTSRATEHLGVCLVPRWHTPHRNAQRYPDAVRSSSSQVACHVANPSFHLLISRKWSAGWKQYDLTPHAAISRGCHLCFSAIITPPCFELR